MDTENDYIQEQRETILQPTLEDFINWLEGVTGQNMLVSVQAEPEILDDLKVAYWNDYLNDLAYAYQAKMEVQL